MIDKNLDQINKYNDKGKLNTLVLYKIKYIYNKRTNKRTNIVETSPLNQNEITHEYILNNLIDDTIEPFEIDEYKIEKILDFVFSGIAKDDHDTSVFVMSQLESINAMSKRTGINRPSLKMSCDRIKIKLKRL